MEMLGSSLRFHYFSLKMAWVDVTAFVTFFQSNLYQSLFFFFLIVIVLTVSELLRVITVDQSSPGPYTKLCSPHCG